uniref:FMRFamide n=1 Tax=Panagrellus redivivus TaxID=6233 RepID=A0A7E4W2C3_PANRE
MLAVALLGVFATSVLATEKPAASSDDVDLASICEDFPHLVACEEALMNTLDKMEKRKSAYMRFGRSNGGIEGDEAAINGAMEKRKSAYMRFGKRSGASEAEVVEPEMEKRKSAYMRFGKRKSAYMRFGKRAVEDFEDAPVQNGLLAPAEKRKSAYMRFGK